MSPPSEDGPRSHRRRSFEVRLHGIVSEGVIAELGAERERSNTVIVVSAGDRSELHGVIRRVEDLGLELVSVVEVPDE